MKQLTTIFVLILCLISHDVSGGETTHAEAIRIVLEQDSQLGTTRNHTSETASIASAVEAYVAGLDALDMSDCPDDFRQAMRSHRDAWHASIPFFTQYPDLRGELHDVFEAIRESGEEARAGLKAVETPIWDTWKQVEAAKEAIR